MKIYYFGFYNKIKKQIEVAEVYRPDSVEYIPEDFFPTKEEAFLFVRDNHAEILRQRILGTEAIIGDLEEQLVIQDNHTGILRQRISDIEANIDDLEEQLVWEKTDLQNLRTELSNFEEFLSDNVSEKN